MDSYSIFDVNCYLNKRIKHRQKAFICLKVVDLSDERQSLSYMLECYT